mgnify:CR=1 FL=1
MIKAIKRIMIFLITVTVIILAILWFFTKNKTFTNSEEEIGNSPGNIYNGGLFSEQDGYIYFSNSNDDGSLYMADSDLINFKKLHDDKAVFINVDENYIYYVRANNTREDSSHNILMYNNTGIYRIKQNGRDIKSISYKPGAYLSLKGNRIYYQKYDVNSGLLLYQNSTDGSEEKRLLNDDVIPSAIMNGQLYYAGYSKDHNLNAIDLSSYNSKTIIEGSFLCPIFHNDYLYYIDIEDNYKIYRSNTDGSNPTLLVDDKCSTYNITNSGKHLYYQIDNGKSNRIARLNLETLESETLLDGDYKQIHVTENYVFFKDFNDTTTFVILADGLAKVGTFEPPNMSENKK